MPLHLCGIGWWRFGCPAKRVQARRFPLPCANHGVGIWEPHLLVLDIPFKNKMSRNRLAVFFLNVMSLFFVIC